MTEVIENQDNLVEGDVQSPSQLQRTFKSFQALVDYAMIFNIHNGAFGTAHDGKGGTLYVLQYANTQEN